jgi:hypothetical protein
VSCFYTSSNSLSWKISFFKIRRLWFDSLKERIESQKIQQFWSLSFFRSFQEVQFAFVFIQIDWVRFVKSHNRISAASKLLSLSWFNFRRCSKFDSSLSSSILLRSIEKLILIMNFFDFSSQFVVFESWW